MSTQQHVSSLGPEGGEDGSFRRQDSTFRDAVSVDGSTDFPLEAGRYHLYVAYRTHPMINPSGLVAMRTAASFDEPAGRA